MALKQFIYALQWHPIDSVPFSVATLRNAFTHAKRFVLHLIGYPTPILRFKDVLPHHCEEYIQDLLNSPLDLGYKYHCLSVLEKLSLYSSAMQDGLVIDPLNGEPAGQVSGWSKARPLEAQTEIIPDEVLGPLVQASLEYIDRYADFLLDANEAVAKLRQHNKERYRFQRLAARYLREHVLKASNFGGGLCARQLNKELCYLQTACFVVIAFATGMRVSELLSLSEGCCEIQTEPGQADLVWLRSRVFKMHGMPQGRSAKWLGGPLCARAVRVLERLSRRTRRQTNSRSLWVHPFHL
ncbi:MAG TPA: hypothetical protein VFY05_01245 [Candidatus Angelobacter sp.]|nr:hypothetical protein [Candidatus Angelobacter sp.]